MEGHRNSGKGALILVVDDDENLRFLADEVLQRAEFEVITARNGHEALDHAMRLPISVVVTDVFMPDADGVELVRALREHCPKLPVVAMSGNELSGNMLPAMRALGSCESLKKPFLPEDLVAVVCKCLGISPDCDSPQTI